MRRFFDGLAILAIAVLGPAGLHADDRQIAQEIVKGLQQQETVRCFGRLQHRPAG